MITRFFCIILVFGLGSACNNRTNGKYQQTPESSEKYQVVSLVFDATVGPDTVWSQNLLMPPVVLQQGGHKSETDNKKIDGVKVHVLINDSLVKFSQRRNRVDFIIEPGSFKENYPGIEEVFQPLLIKLIGSSVSEPFDIFKLKSRYNYHIDYVSNKDKYSSSVMKIGRVKMTSPIFNNDLTIACVYSEIICGGECGSGSIFFLKKLNDHWEIVGRKELWVA